MTGEGRPNAGDIRGRKGEEVSVAITWLEMARRPEGPFPPAPLSQHLALMRAETPPPEYFLYLYRLVGQDHEWTDRLDDAPEVLERLLHDPDVALFSLLHEGWPAAFFLLDWRQAGVCDLAYFGLSPALRGRRLGPWLLGEALRAGWARPGVEKMTLNTCALDHPGALPLYQRMGFSPVRRTEATRVLSRDIP